MKIFNLILMVLGLLIFPIVSAVTFENANIETSSTNYNVYPNTTMNFTELDVSSTLITINNLSGGGNFTNIGSIIAYIQFIDLIPHYNNVRWHNLSTETENVANFMVVMNPSELIEIYYKFHQSTATTTTITGKITTGGFLKGANYTPYIIAIIVLIVLIFLLLIAIAEVMDRRKRKA
jgi:hypothetical protein